MCPEITEKLNADFICKLPVSPSITLSLLDPKVVETDKMIKFSTDTTPPCSGFGVIGCGTANQEYVYFYNINTYGTTAGRYEANIIRDLKLTDEILDTTRNGKLHYRIEKTTIGGFEHPIYQNILKESVCNKDNIILTESSLPTSPVSGQKVTVWNNGNWYEMLYYDGQWKRSQ